jgi:hypothetical protein
MHGNEMVADYIYNTYQNIEHCITLVITESFNAACLDYVSLILLSHVLYTTCTCNIMVMLGLVLDPCTSPVI